MASVKCYSYRFAALLLTTEATPMKLTIANALAMLAVCAALVPAARASDPPASQPPVPRSARLALATSDATSEDLSPIRLSASNLTYGNGAVDLSNRRIELERAPRGIEFEICHHKEIFSFVDATTYTFFQCRP